MLHGQGTASELDSCEISLARIYLSYLSLSLIYVEALHQIPLRSF